MNQLNNKNFRVILILFLTIFTSFWAILGKYLISIISVFIGIMYIYKCIIPKIKAGKQKTETHNNGSLITNFIFIPAVWIGAFLLLYFSRGEMKVAGNVFYYLESIAIFLILLIILLMSIYTFTSLIINNKIILQKIPEKYKKFVLILLYTFSIGLSIFLIYIPLTFIWIRYEVKNICLETKYEYGGDCVESLTGLLNDEERGFRARNSAVWALGQLADKRVLPVLQKYYTGSIPSREPLNNTISQHELKKAIKWCREGNLTSWMYKENL